MDEVEKSTTPPPTPLPSTCRALRLPDPMRQGGTASKKARARLRASLDRARDLPRSV